MKPKDWFIENTKKYLKEQLPKLTGLKVQTDQNTSALIKVLSDTEGQLPNGQRVKIVKQGKVDNVAVGLKMNSDTWLVTGTFPGYVQYDQSVKQLPYIILGNGIFNDPFFLQQMDKPEKIVQLDYSDISIESPWVFNYTQEFTCDGSFSRMGNSFKGAFFSQNGKYLIQYILNETSFAVAGGSYYQGTFDGSPVCNSDAFAWVTPVPYTTGLKVSFKIYKNFSIDKDLNIKGAVTHYTNLNIDLSGFPTAPTPGLVCGSAGPGVTCLAGVQFDTPTQSFQNVLNNFFIANDVGSDLVIDYIGGWETITTIFCIKNWVASSGGDNFNFFNVCGINSGAFLGFTIKGVLNSFINQVITTNTDQSPTWVEQFFGFPSFTGAYLKDKNTVTAVPMNSSATPPSYFYNGIFLDAKPNHSFPINNTDYFTCNSLMGFTREGTFADNSILRAKFVTDSSGAAFTNSINGTGHVKDPLIYKYSTKKDSNGNTVIGLGKKFTGTIDQDFFFILDYTLH